MAVTSGFFNSVAGDRVYTAEDISSMFEGMVSEGVFATVGNSFFVTYNAGTMTITVGPGRAWFSNTWLKNSENLVLTVDQAEPILNRIDSVIIEFDRSVGVRANSIKIKKGTPGSSPVAPTMTSTTDVKQYRIADVYVGAGVTQITAGNITNKVGTTGTPFVANVVGASFNLQTFITQMEGEFDYWMATLVNELSSNQVTNLQAQITQLQTGWTAIGGTCTYVSADGPIFVMNVTNADATPIGVGYKIRLTQTTEKYFIVVAKGAPSGANTPITLYGGTDSTLTNAAITFPFYSNARTPINFPMDPDKWTITVTDTTLRTKTSPIVSTWFHNVDSGNLPWIDIPIGAWNIFYSAMGRLEAAIGASFMRMEVALSTSTSSVSDTSLVSANSHNPGVVTTAAEAAVNMFRNLPKIISVAVKTRYYMIFMAQSSATPNSISLQGSIGTTVIKAVCAYL